jgi:iron complex transport system permease protein
MNVMMLGDEAAATLGIDLTKYRLVYMIVASLLVGIIVTICGLVGYVGLIIPHIARGLVGTDHRKMLPLSICLGAVFLIWCDVAARSILVGSELPLGLITSIIGAPILMYRIVKQGFGSTDK